MRYTITGRVHPERAAVEFSKVGLDIGNRGKATLHCDASQLTVVLDIDSSDDAVLARNTAEHLAQMIVSSLGFSLGTGYSVEIIQVIPENKDPLVFGVRPAQLDFNPHQSIFNKALRLSGSDVFFRLAIRDYGRALVDVSDCALYCYRAIEAIQSAFVPEGEQAGWKEMHAALNTNRETIQKTVKHFADPIRHGNWSQAKDTNSAQRTEMLQLTRDILYRYLELKGT